jgi:type III restriction enzyme
MPKPVVSYDKELPEIEERLGKAHLPPESHLRKKDGSEDEFEILEGRRPSKLLLVEGLRRAVMKWRDGSYPGASSVTTRLFSYWFENDHVADGHGFRFYFAQREALETLAYLVEIAQLSDSKALVDSFGEIFYPEDMQERLPGSGITHETTMDGIRRIRRYIPELEGETVQDLPPEDLARYALKMATGSGKTVVMAMVMVWSYFHKRSIPNSPLSTNFLLLAPNVIVFQRLEKDFGDNRIFRQLPLIPPEWQAQWSMKVILRGESSEPDSNANLFLTNIHHVYESTMREPDIGNAVARLLGRKPAGSPTQERPMLERIMQLKDLVVMNDEAHHVHDEELQWYRSLISVHTALPKGLALWLDLSATPKDQNGTYFPWIICDYPLAQAVEDRIVKAPLIVHRVEKADPDHVTGDNVVEAYGDWLLAAMSRLEEHQKAYNELGVKPVLFIMAEQNKFADKIGEWLKSTKEIGLKKDEVLVIHTDNEGEVRKSDIEVAREAARDVDSPTNKIKVIVSVLMLREGWDVRNVSVVLGLRPFTSKAHILPEQAVGRGLRLVEGVSPDRTQTLEVLGTKAFEEFVRRLELEGVGIKTMTKPPKPPVKVEAVEQKANMDIAIPLTRPFLARNYKRLEGLDSLTLDPIYEQEELDEPVRNRLRFEFATTGTGVGQVDVAAGPPPFAQDLLSSITSKTIQEARLAGGFAELYPVVRSYVTARCFGKEVDPESELVRSHLRGVLMQQGIARYLARKIGALTIEHEEVEFERPDFKLSHTTPFIWRRNLPLMESDKTIFNLVATYNDYEKDFGKFLHEADDILRFASLGTTEQDSGTSFRVDYLKPSGAIGLYYPDWVAVQGTPDGEVNWIIETKGRVWEGTENKDAAIEYWCEQISDLTGNPWRYIRVNQSLYQTVSVNTLSDLLEAIPEKGADSLVLAPR